MRNKELEEALTHLNEEAGVAFHVDSQDVCKIMLDPLTFVQIEYNASRESILLFSQVAQLAHGPYLLTILQEIARANDGLFAENGILSYSERKGAIMIHLFLKYEFLTAPLFLRSILLFIEKLRLWRDVIEKGSPSPLPKA